MAIRSIEIPLLTDHQHVTGRTDSGITEIITRTLAFSPPERAPLTLSLKGLLSICGVAGRIPYFPQMQRLANGNNSLGVFYKTVSLPVYSTDYMWSSIRMVNEIQVRNSQRSTSNSSRAYALMALALPIILGMLAQLPLIALALKYNPDSPAMVALTAMDAVMPIYSVFVLMTLWSKKSTEKTDPVTEKCLSNLDLLKKDLLISKTDKLSLLLDDNSSLDAKTTKLIELLDTPIADDAVRAESRCRQIASYCAKGSGVLLTLVFLAWLGAFTYEGSAHFYDDPVVDSIIAVFTVFINAALIGTLFIDTHAQIAKSAEERIARKFTPTFISETVSPTTAPYIKGACVVFVLFQAMAAIQISRDYLPSEYVIPNAIALSLAFIVPAYFPVRQLTDWAIQEILLRRGSPEQKKMIQLYQIIEHLNAEFSFHSFSSHPTLAKAIAEKADSEI